MAKRILIIDDDKDMLEMLHIIFQESEYDVVLSNTGLNFEQIKLLHPDIVLLDVRIEGYEKTGDQICNEVKLNDKLLPVFLVSGERNLAEIANNCYADEYFNKPFDIKLLKSKVNSRLL